MKLLSKTNEVLPELEQPRNVHQFRQKLAVENVQLSLDFPKMTLHLMTFSYVWTGHEAWGLANANHWALLSGTELKDLLCPQPCLKLKADNFDVCQTNLF